MRNDDMNEEESPRCLQMPEPALSNT